MDLTYVSAGAMLPAPGLLTACSLVDSQDVSLTACSLGDSQDVSLFAQGMAMTNVDVCLSSGRKHYNCTTAVASCGCGDGATGFPSALASSFSLCLHSALT